MAIQITLNGAYFITNSTNNKLIGYKVLSEEIIQYQDLIIEKGTNKKEIEIEYIRQLDNNKYYVSNSNISLIIST